MFDSVFRLRRCLAAGVLALFVCAMLWFQLAQEPYLRGYDAYYYAVQADYWFRTGRLRIPDSSVVLYAIGMLQYLGISTEMAVRLWTGISLGLFYASFILLLTRCRSLPFAIALFAWALASPAITFVVIELPKTFALLPLLNVALYLITAERIRWSLLFVVLALAVACHKMALAYIAAFAIALAFRLFGQRINWRRGRWLSYGVFAVFLAVLLAVFLAGTLGRADLLRLKGNNLMPGLVSLVLQPGAPQALLWEIAFAALFVTLAWLRGAKRERLLVLLLLCTALVPAFGAEPLNFGERFALLFPYLALVSCVLLLREAKPERAIIPALAALIIGLAVLPFRLAYSYPAALNPPYARYDAITEELADHEIPMLILHRGMHFYYKYATRRDAFSYEPEAHWNKQRVWRLVYGVTPEEVFANLPTSCAFGREVISLQDKAYTLMREDCFFTMRAAVDGESNPQLYGLLWKNEMNPSKPRPAFLYGKHESDETDEFPALPAGK